MEQPSGLDHSQETDIAWLAGFIDGEGSMTLDRRPYRHGEVGLTVAVHFSNTDFPTIEHASAVLKQNGIATDVWIEDTYSCHTLERKQEQGDGNHRCS